MVGRCSPGFSTVTSLTAVRAAPGVHLHRQLLESVGPSLQPAPQLGQLAGVEVANLGDRLAYLAFGGFHPGLPVSVPVPFAGFAPTLVIPAPQEIRRLRLSSST